MDLARLDLMIRSGLWKILEANGWYPVVVAETVQFRRSLNLFDQLKSNPRAGLGRQGDPPGAAVVRGEEVVAHALVRARFL